jgi:hypothetical protein
MTGMVLGRVPFTNMSDSPALHSRWLLLLKLDISSIVHYCFIIPSPTKLRRDIVTLPSNVIFYQNMPNLHNRYKLAERKISQKNTEYMLNYSFPCSCSKNLFKSSPLKPLNQIKPNLAGSGDGPWVGPFQNCVRQTCPPFIHI